MLAVCTTDDRMDEKGHVDAGVSKMAKLRSVYLPPPTLGGPSRLSQMGKVRQAHTVTPRMASAPCPWVQPPLPTTGGGRLFQLLTDITST